MGAYMSSDTPKTSWSTLHAEVQKLGEDFEVELDDGKSGDEFLFRCTKNPDHTNMTPMSKFTMDDIPAPWRCKMVYNKIIRKARLVVKISVPYISSDRPVGYAFWQRKGQWTPRPTVGSGHALAIKPVQDLPSVDCPLPHCTRAGNHKTTSPFKVITARHVVFDDSEAEHAKIEFFFDSTDRSGVIRGEIINVDMALSDSDQSVLWCVSHELNLIKQLFSDLPQIDLESALPPIQGPRSPLAVVIAHPHGSFKRVSFGDLVCYKYDTKSNEATETINHMKICEILEIFEKNAPNFETEGYKVDKAFISPDFLAILKDQVHRNPNMTHYEMMKSLFKRQSIQPMNSLESQTYTAATCSGSSGGYVSVFLEDPPGSPCETMFATHYKHRSGKRNISGTAVMHSAYLDSLKKCTKRDSPRQHKRHSKHTAS